MPNALVRKKAAALKSSKINAAPAMADTEDAVSPIAAARPDLVSMLKEQLGPVPPKPSEKSTPATSSKVKDGYGKFLEEMEDLLGTST